MSRFEVKVGQRWTLKGPVDVENCQVGREGMSGEVVESPFDGEVWLKMDEAVPELEDWDNCFVFLEPPEDCRLIEDYADLSGEP